MTYEGILGQHPGHPLIVGLGQGVVGLPGVLGHLSCPNLHAFPDGQDGQGSAGPGPEPGGGFGFGICDDHVAPFTPLIILQFWF